MEAWCGLRQAEYRDTIGLIDYSHWGEQVFRAIGIAVVVAVIAPTLALFALQFQSPEDKLPACCRRDGKHHCAMMGKASAASAETQMRALPEPCPFRTQASTATYVVSYVPQAAAIYFAALQSHPAIHAQVRAAFRISEERTHQKRGPPAISC